MEIIHDPGRSVLLVKVVMRDCSWQLGILTRDDSCTVEPRLSRPSVVCKSISKTSEGTVFSLEEKKDRAHLTRTSDTSCMIEGYSDDERKTRVHLEPARP